MSKSTKIVGIDVSKKHLDVYSEQEGSHRYENPEKGFKAMLKTYGKSSHYVMENTGYYHYRLAYYLRKKGLQVTVENALKIKRFIQMQLTRVKTDKADSKLIWQYGMTQELRIWELPDELKQESDGILSLLELYEKQSVALKNKLQGEASMGVPSKTVVRSMKRMLKEVEQEIKKLEEQLEALVMSRYAEEVKQLRSIPGIGAKTSILLAVFTDGMRRFESGGQLSNYVGLTPVIRESGSSVRGRSRISKMGNGKLRKQLFMCSFNAMKYNKTCKDLYERITAQGKSGKIALLAICNKLLKQAFGVVKSGKLYDENYSVKIS